MTITMTPASEVKVGDVFSTDGLVVRQTTVEVDGRITIGGVCHGLWKQDTVSPDQPMPIWKEEA